MFRRNRHILPGNFSTKLQLIVTHKSRLYLYPSQKKDTYCFENHLPCSLLPQWDSRSTFTINIKHKHINLLPTHNAYSLNHLPKDELLYDLNQSHDVLRLQKHRKYHPHIHSENQYEDEQVNERYTFYRFEYGEVFLLFLHYVYVQKSLMDDSFLLQTSVFVPPVSEIFQKMDSMSQNERFHQ